MPKPSRVSSLRFDTSKPAYTATATVFFTSFLDHGAESEAFAVERHFHDGKIAAEVALISLTQLPKVDDDQLALIRDIPNNLASGNGPSEAITLPNGVRTYATFVDPKARSLAHALSAEPGNTIPVEKMVGIMARTLLALHERGIVHGDIKPGNILLDDDGNSLVCDWGHVKANDHCSIASSKMGTPHYMAPEVPIGQSSDKSDVFSLCYTAYEAVTGRPARVFYEGKDRVDFDWLNSVVNQQRILKTQDPLFNQILSNGTWNDPVKRSSPLDMLSDLAAYPQAWKEYPPALQQQVLAHVAQRHADTPRRSPDLDAAVLAYQEKKAPADLAAAQRQIPLRAERPEPPALVPGALHFSNDAIFRPDVLRGEAIGISRDTYQAMNQADYTAIREQWQQSIATGKFSAEQREALLAIRAHHRHLNGSSTENVSQTVVTDWSRFERSLNVDSVYIAHRQVEDQQQVVAEGVAIRRGDYLVPDGLWVTTNNDGRLAACTTYQQGIKEGEERTFHANGTIAKITNYLHNLPHGAESEYDANGTQTCKRTHEHGHLMKESAPAHANLVGRAKRLFLGR